MNAGIDNLIQRAYFISPVVDMEKLIIDCIDPVTREPVNHLCARVSCASLSALQRASTSSSVL